jgi:N-dimethylarginine dimethylaminohydrolase
MNGFGVASMTAPLRRVALRRPVLEGVDPSAWHYGAGFDPARAGAEHAAFVRLLDGEGIDILWIDGESDIADAVFTYDASLMTPAGAVLMSPGKALRRGEETLHAAFYETHDIPVIGAIGGAARMEAGDTLWLGPDHLAAGRGFRTNAEGIARLTDIMARQGIAVEAFDLPGYGGEAACLHLMSLVSLVDTRTALVCEPLLPVALRQRMEAMGYTLLAAPFGEFGATGTLSTNVLALAPGRCVMVEGIPKTRTVLEEAGIAVAVFPGDALCIACEGGPTCLTRPVLRVEDA